MQNNTKIKQLLQAQKKKKAFYYVLALSLLAYLLTPFLALYIWSHAPGPCWDMSSVSLEWPEQRHRLHKKLPVRLQ